MGNNLETTCQLVGLAILLGLLRIAKFQSLKSAAEPLAQDG